MPAPPRYEIGFAWLGTPPPRTPRTASQSAVRTPPRRHTPQARGPRTSTRAAAAGSAELRLSPQSMSHNSAQSRSRAVATSPDQARRNAVLTRAPAHASARQPLRFEVQARDAHGVALAHGVSDCRMRLRGPTDCELEVTDCGDGRYEAVGGAPISGRYLLLATLDGAWIRVRVRVRVRMRAGVGAGIRP